MSANESLFTIAGHVMLLVTLDRFVCDEAVRQSKAMEFTMYIGGGVVVLVLIILLVVLLLRR